MLREFWRGFTHHSLVAHSLFLLALEYYQGCLSSASIANTEDLCRNSVAVAATEASYE